MFRYFVTFVLVIFFSALSVMYLFNNSQLKKECKGLPLSYKSVYYSMKWEDIRSNCADTPFKSKGKYYSQFYEDYTLSSVLDDKSSGFYIDVGAHHPTNISATYYFYKKGWSGILIEPNPDLIGALKEVRPRDIVMQIALSNQEGIAELLVPNNQKEIASLEQGIKKHATSSLKTHKVQMKTLSSVIDALKIKEIDFIKIDVEGHEQQVLEGINMVKHRPKIFVLEHSSPVAMYQYKVWEPILLKNKYVMGLDDGLNRYYYREEDSDVFKQKFSQIRQCVKVSGWLSRKGQPECL